MAGSVAVGALAALAGVYAGPRVPRRTNLDWAMGAAIVAAATAAGWGLLHTRLLATMTPFVLVTYLAGEWRTRRAAHGASPDAFD
ncbi:hypothetical protein KDL01_02175 [Actinospica durhamensis]|uniref:Uncharacterized protein n=1 Tax=Actinospica durhamensis TaxID=1508375 RepID=A0A941IR88_9ACTN|nr:hypothetical protein [Actinospica durhamensis]MBR7832046.1 hypothetical protein [Actinospica durhamensis]